MTVSVGVGRMGRSRVGWSAKLGVGNRRSAMRGALAPGGRSSVSHFGITSRAITGKRYRPRVMNTGETAPCSCRVPIVGV